MTDITDDEAREAVWASSEEGRAQLAATWGAACRLRLDGWGLTRADVGALLWAAHEVRAPEPPEGPRHTRMLELITEAGQDGITLREVVSQLTAEFGNVRREAVNRWAVQDAAAGLLEQFDGRIKAMWRAVQR